MERFLICLPHEATIIKTKIGPSHFDTAPTDISAGGGVAAPVKSLFQTDLLAIRVCTNRAWAVAAGAAQVIAAAN